MGDTSKFFELLKSLAEQLPSFITMVACIGFAISRRRRYPRVSLVVIIGLSLLILHLFVSDIVYTWVPGWFIKSDNYDPITARNVYLVIGLISNSLLGIFLSVLLVAVFMQRRTNARAPERGLYEP